MRFGRYEDVSCSGDDMPRIPAALAVVLALLAGCADFPDFGDPLGDHIAEPQIVDIAALGLGDGASPQDQQRAVAAMQARVAALRARARALQKPVIDTKTRVRMDRALRRFAS